VGVVADVEQLAVKIVGADVNRAVDRVIPGIVQFGMVAVSGGDSL
jgi:hypothetical protein